MTSPWFAQLGKIGRSAARLYMGLESLIGPRFDPRLREDLEILLIQADLGAALASRLATEIVETARSRDLDWPKARKILLERITTILAPAEQPLVINPHHQPHVILIIGINGSGKTTTIGKLAHLYRKQGFSVMLAAADTFRAAAVDQLRIWGERTDTPVVALNPGSDPAAVAFRAHEQACADNIDLLIVDSAGRLHNKDPLMAQLGKIINILGKRAEEAPHDIILTIDATIGQNSLIQATTFRERAALSGLIVTKLDSNPKCGTLIAITENLALPIHALGVGEGLDDLIPFEAHSFTAAMLGRSNRDP